MRTIKIPFCEYPLFERIRDSYVKHAPWALEKTIYSRQLKTAVFTFHDTRYIVPWLTDFILEPPADLEAINDEIYDKCSDELTEILQQM